MWRTLLFVGFVAILLPVEHAYSQDTSQYSQDNFRKGFIRGLRNEDVIRGKVIPMRLGHEKTELAIQNYLLLVNDDAVANRVFDEFVATGLLRKYQRNLKSLLDDPERLQSIGNEIFDMLGVKGMRRLDYTDQRVYLEAIGGMYETMPPKMCRALIKGDLSGDNDTTALGIFIVRSMTVREAENYFRVYRKAALAEARNYPAIREVTESQRKIAEDAFSQVLLTNLASHPRSEKIATAMVDSDTASDRDLCESGSLIMKSLLGMTGAVAEWYTRSFIDSIQ